MRLFAFTREEGSDERNPWAILLRRRRAWLTDMVLMAIGLGCVVFFTRNLWTRAGILSTAPLTALAVAVVGGLLHVSALWQRIARSPLLAESAVTPQRADELMAALERRARRWVHFTAILVGVTLLNALVHLARVEASEFPALIPVHLMLFVTVWMAAVAFVYALMGLAASGTFISHAMTPAQRLGCGCTGLLLILMGVPAVAAALIQSVASLGESLPMGLPLVARTRGLSGISPRALATVPAVFAVLAATAAVALWLIGRALWDSHREGSLDALRQSSERERSRKTRWLF